MPRYYFNLMDGRDHIIDPDGVDLGNEPFRLEDVLCALEELRSEERPEVVDEWQGWTLEIVDSQGRTIHVITL